MRFTDSPASRAMGGGLAPRYGYWSVSETDRFVVSIHDTDILDSLADCVVLIVAHEGGTRRPLWIGDAGPFTGLVKLHPQVRRAVRQGNVEVHVHALAETPAERADLVAACARSGVAERQALAA